MMSKDPFEKKRGAVWILVLHIALVIYSLSTVLSKYASGEEFFSLRFFLLYGGDICLLGIYAVVWQQVLKRLPLVFSYANKAVTVAWGLLWGYLFFSEKITMNKLLGAAAVIAGIIIYSSGERTADERV